MYLNTKIQDHGIFLTDPNNVWVGDIFYRDGSWQFQAINGSVGPMRQKHKSAEYDALAYLNERD